MDIFRFHNWCTVATRGIKYKPDRDAVWKELFNHLQDRQEEFMSQGLSENDARIKAMDAMGNPEEIAPLLAKIHQPFWGFAYSISKWVLILILCFSLNPTITYLSNLPQGNTGEHWAFQDTPTFHGYPIHIWEPEASASTDGYTFTVKKAAIWHYPESDGSDYTMMLQIEAFNPLPWAEHSNLFHNAWAEDSLGNKYENFYQHINRYESNAPYLQGYCTTSGLFCANHWIGFTHFCSQDAKWIDLHYHQEGRDMVFHIDLPGGDSE